MRCVRRRIRVWAQTVQCIVLCRAPRAIVNNLICTVASCSRTTHKKTLCAWVFETFVVVVVDFFFAAFFFGHFVCIICWACELGAHTTQCSQWKKESHFFSPVAFLLFALLRVFFFCLLLFSSPRTSVSYTDNVYTIHKWNDSLVSSFGFRVLLLWYS